MLFDYFSIHGEFEVGDVLNHVFIFLSGRCFERLEKQLLQLLCCIIIRHHNRHHFYHRYGSLDGSFMRHGEAHLYNAV